MIDFKVLQSPEKSQQGNYQHFKPELVIGNNCTGLIIDDQNIAEQQIKIFFKAEQAYIENLYPDVDVKVNNKVISGKVPLNAKDTVQFGKTSLNFTRLATTLPVPPQWENPNFASRFAEGTTEKTLIEVLDFLAGQNPNTPPPPPGKGMPPMPKTPVPPPPKKG